MSAPGLRLVESYEKLCVHLPAPVIDMKLTRAYLL